MDDQQRLELPDEPHEPLIATPESAVSDGEPVPTLAQPEPPTRDFEDLTLAEALGGLWSAPRETIRALVAVAQMPSPKRRTQPRASAGIPPPSPMQPAWVGDAHPLPASFAESYTPAADIEYRRQPPVQAGTVVYGALSVRDQVRAWVSLLIRVVAFVFAVYGGIIMLPEGNRGEDNLNQGAPFFLAAFGIWLLAELVAGWRDIARRDEAPTIPPRYALTPAVGLRGSEWTQRLGLAGLGTVLSFGAWQLNSGNFFTFTGVLCWFASIFVWVWVVAPAGWTPLDIFRWVGSGVRRIRLRFSWTLVALLAIIAVGAYFRLEALPDNPPEMTSDHVEKALDAFYITRGLPNVFFANNQGREPLHFYFLALLAGLPGMRYDFTWLKIGTVIEGILTIPVLWWFGREMIGAENRRLGNLVGLILAAMVAVSFWHVMLSRLALRIVLTPLFGAFILIFLTRAMRYNRREDYILTGLALGVGLYAYQAVRMFPVVIMAGAALALLLNWRGLQAWGRVAGNFAALVLVAFVIFVPLFRFWVEYPEDFWRRTTGRFFGDNIVETTDEFGNLVRRDATLQDRIDAFNANVPQLRENIRTALLMYNWKGDVAWINNAPNEPAMDRVVGALFAVGLIAWLARMIRRRDAVDWLVPIGIFILLLPTALSIAFPIENPSFTRASGSLPFAFLVAAYPLALGVNTLWRLLKRAGLIIGVIVTISVIGASYIHHHRVYFHDFYLAYRTASLPYSDAGKVLRDFGEEFGYGNAFIIAYPYWWDHRAVGIEAGKPDYPNGIPNLRDAPNFIRDAAQRITEYRFDPDKPLLFFYATGHFDAERWLNNVFPGGTTEIIQSSHPEDTFNVYRALPIGAENFAEWIERARLALPAE